MSDVREREVLFNPKVSHKTEWISIRSFDVERSPWHILYIYIHPTQQIVWLYYTYASLYNFSFVKRLFIFIFIYLLEMSTNTQRQMIARALATWTKEIIHKVWYICLHVPWWILHASARIRQSAWTSIVYSCVRPRAAFLSFCENDQRRRCDPPATFRENTTFRGTLRVDRISPVIYSMRVGDVSPSFVVILLAVSWHGGARDESKTRVERGLKRGKGTRTGECHGARRFSGTINIIYFRLWEIRTREICLVHGNTRII